MLILTRKQGERIQIGDSITITVKRIDGNRVRIGVEAPASWAVVRSELLEDGGGTKPPSETDVGKDAQMNATQVSDEAEQEDD